MQAFDDALDRAITITWFANNLSALIRLRLENFCLTGIGTDLYDQYPAGCSPLVETTTNHTPSIAALVLPRRYPPAVILKAKTVAVWANV